MRLNAAQAEKRRLEAQKNQLQEQLEAGMRRAAADAKDEADQQHQHEARRLQQELDAIKTKNAQECNHLLELIQKMKEEKEAAEATSPETWLICGVVVPSLL